MSLGSGKSGRKISEHGHALVRHPMRRRAFLGSMVALAATAHPLLACSELHHGQPEMAPTTHLDLATARKISAGFQATPPDETDILDLSNFRSASVEAMEILASLEFGFAEIGFTDLNTAAAKAFSAWKTYFMMFDRLAFVSPEAAMALGSHDAEHAFVFTLLNELDSVSAGHLVNATGTGCPLSLRLSGPMTSQVARALAGHGHELFIDLDAPLQPSAAEELAFHHGYILEIRSQVPISLQAIERLGANPAKSLSLSPPAEMDASVPNHAPRQWMATLIDSV